MCGKAKPLLIVGDEVKNRYGVTPVEKADANVRVHENFVNLAKEEARISNDKLVMHQAALTSAREELVRQQKLAMKKLKVLKHPGIRIDGFGIVTPAQLRRATHVQVWVGNFPGSHNVREFKNEEIGHRISEDWNF